LCNAYRASGFESVTKGDKVFRDLALVRIIEPTSKADSLRVLGGIEQVSLRTLTRRLPVFAKDTFRQPLSAACTRHGRLNIWTAERKL
jgi:hypothetical protein